MSAAEQVTSPKRSWKLLRDIVHRLVNVASGFQIDLPVSNRLEDHWAELRDQVPRGAILVRG